MRGAGAWSLQGSGACVRSRWCSKKSRDQGRALKILETPFEEQFIEMAGRGRGLLSRHQSMGGSAFSQQLLVLRPLGGTGHVTVNITLWLEVLVVSTQMICS